MRRCGIALPPLATALTLLSTTSCGRHREQRALEQQVAKAVGRAIDVAGIIAHCDGTAPTTCHVAIAGSRGIEVSVKRADDGGWRWAVDGSLVSTARAVAYLDGELADLGVAAHTNCGATLRVIARGERMACLIAAPGTLEAIPSGIAWVTTSASGPIEVEIAFGMAAVEARWNASDDAMLTAMSLHLADGGSVNDDVDGLADPGNSESTDDDGASP